MHTSWLNNSSDLGKQRRQIESLLADKVMLAEQIVIIHKTGQQYELLTVRDRRKIADVLRAHSDQCSNWEPISTRPHSDDLMWFCIGNTFDGPRKPAFDDADYWDWWCHAIPPELPTSDPDAQTRTRESAGSAPPAVFPAPTILVKSEK